MNNILYIFLKNKYFKNLKHLQKGLTLNSIRNKFLILFLILGQTFTINYAQEYSNEIFSKYSKISKQIVESALYNKNGYKLLDQLCRIGPRLSGSENSIKAINWAKNKMDSLGFENVWLEPVMVPHWERGEKEECEIVKSKFNKDKKLNVLALGGSIGTPVNGITAEVIEVKNLEDIDSLKDKIKGKIVYYSSPMDSKLLYTFHAYGLAVQKRVYGAVRAAQYGAVGVLIRSITTKYDNVPHTGVLLYANDVQKIPAAALGYADSDFLSDALKKDPNLKIKIKMSCKILQDAKSYNVIGEIKGTEKPEEIIDVGGHIDSWDVGQGAHDDGAGCIQSIEALNLIKRLNLKPKRTIRCVLFINEENGSRGSLAYSNFVDSTKENHIAAIESDAGGFDPRGFTVQCDSSTLEKIQSWLRYLKNADIEYVNNGGSGADISRIKNTKALIGLHPDNQRYFDFHHSANDLFSAVNARELELGSAAVAILAYVISQEGL